MDENEYKKGKVIRSEAWPEGDHARGMLLERGPEALSDTALLAILLDTGRKGKNVWALARETLTAVGGFRGLISVTPEDLQKIKGMGKAKIARVLSAMEIVKRQLRQPLERSNVIQNPEDLFAYIKLTIGTLSREEFRVLYLSRSRHLIADEALFRGTADHDSDYPAEIVENAIKKKAAALILVHHHPIDLPIADDGDIALTRTIVKACWAVDMAVIDHIIIGRNGLLSMKKHLPGIFEGEDEIA